MATDILSPALIASMVGHLSVADLIRTTETFKQSGQTASIEAAYAAWVQANPDDPLLYAVLFNYSIALTDTGKLDAAQQSLERAIALNADFMPAYINLGRILERQGKIGLAIIQWSAALARMAAVSGQAIMHKTTALNQSARALEAVSQDEAAEKMLRESLELDRDQREVVQHLVALRQRQCEWPVLLPSERVSRETLFMDMSPLSAAAHADDPLMQLALADRYNRRDVGTPEGALTAWPAAMAHEGPLRVGYLSSDLREHAVGYLMTEVLGLHDRDKVAVHAYYCGIPATDALHAHFRDTADRFTVFTDLGDAAAAQPQQAVPEPTPAPAATPDVAAASPSAAGEAAQAEPAPEASQETTPAPVAPPLLPASPSASAPRAAAPDQAATPQAPATAQKASASPAPSAAAKKTSAANKAASPTVSKTGSPAPAAPKPAAAAAREPAGKGKGKDTAKGFVALQTGLFADAANAQGQAAKLRGRGIPACLVEEGQGKTKRYRVLAGRYGERRAALAARNEVRAAAGVSPLVFEVAPGMAAGLRCH